MQNSAIRYRPDGSIDTAHYMAIGRGMRSEAAHGMARGAKRRASGLLGGLGGWIRTAVAAPDANA
jgi:hypothetical protein